MNTDCFIPLKEVVRQTSLSRSEIYRQMAEGRFPKQIKLSPRRVAWRQSEIQLWIRRMVSRNVG